MTLDINPPDFTPQALLELYGANTAPGSTCALLTPAIRAKLQELASGEVLEVRVDDLAAREDIFSWSRLSGNQVLWMSVEEPQHLRFFLKKK